MREVRVGVKAALPKAREVLPGLEKTREPEPAPLEERKEPERAPFDKKELQQPLKAAPGAL
jgi:hypothetical protein